MKEDHPLPSNRSFATVFIVVFLLAAVWQMWRGATGWASGWFTAAFLTAVVAMVKPALLTPLNRAWMGVGRLLGHVVSPVVLGVMYAVLIIPVGLIMRLARRDAMLRRFTHDGSYWQPRADGKTNPERFKNQF